MKKYKFWDQELSISEVFPEITVEECAKAFTLEDEVNLIMSHGWDLISVSSVGGCRKNPDRYHFVKRNANEVKVNLDYVLRDNR